MIKPGYEGIVISLGMFAIALTILALLKLVIGI
jgi:hypothetical protein